MLPTHLISFLYLIDLFIKTFVLATFTYFFGGSLLTLAKQALYFSSSRQKMTVDQHKNATNIISPSGPQLTKNSKGCNDGMDPQLTTEPGLDDKEPGLDSCKKKRQPTNSEYISMHKQLSSIPKDLPSDTRRRSRTQSFPSHLVVPSTRSSDIELTYHSPAPPSSQPSTSSIEIDRRPSRRDSRVGQLVQRFETGRSATNSSTSICNSTDMLDLKGNPSVKTLDDINKSLLIDSTMNNITTDPSPAWSSSPNKLTSPVSTRAIDYRSIGFRPAFTTWEKRVTEGNPLLVPIKSRSSPVWCTKSA